MIPVIDAKDVNYIHCRCDCPMFGREYHDKTYLVTCECGDKEVACGYCLEAGRVTECLGCARARRYNPCQLN